MEFGIVSSSELSNIDFKLPGDGEFTKELLKGGKKSAQSEVRIGLSKWGRKAWIGRLYADRTKESQFLHHYTKLFNTIELNAVFYTIPPPDLILKWKAMVDAAHTHDFIFLPKMSRVITHIKRLKDAEAEAAQFINTVNLFGKHLGPILIQLGDNAPPSQLSVMEDFIKGLPADGKYVMELRHEEWFSDPYYRKAVFGLFKEHQIGTVITDAHGRRDCLHMELTNRQAYIRFNGTDGLNRTIDFMRIDEWSLRLKDWVDKGLEKIYFIISQRDDSTTPELVQYAIQRFNEVLGTFIPEISWNADAPMTNLPAISFEEWISSEVKSIKDEIENGRDESID